MKMNSRKLLFTVAALAAFSVLAAACGGGGDETPTGGGNTGSGSPATSEPAATGGSFSISICEPQSLQPPKSAETCGSQVLQALFTPLVGYDPSTAEPHNLMADSIDTTDQTNFDIKIKSGYTFHDGTPVTAQSFVDAWNWAALGANAADNNYFFAPGAADIVGYADLNPSEGDATTTEMSGLVVVSDTEFTVELSQPLSIFPSMLGYNAFYPLPESFFTDPDAFNEQPVGNGPYEMDGAWEHDQFVKVKKYADYTGTPGNADNVEFRIYADLDTSFLDVQAGTLDIGDVPTDQIATAPQEFGDRFIQTPSSSFSYLGFPVYDAKFQNKALRQAISMAIDREAITTAIFGGTRTPADDMAAPVVDGYRQGACQYCTLDVAGAQAKLQEAGGWTGTMELWFNNDGGHEQWMQALANQLRDNLGIESEFQSIPFADYLTKLSDKAVTGPYRLGWVMDYPSIQDYLAPIHGCDASSNYSGYCNQQFDDLLSQANAASDTAAANSLYQQADDIILEDLDIVPLWYGLNQQVTSENVSNVIVDVFSFIRVPEVQVVAS